MKKLAISLCLFLLSAPSPALSEWVNVSASSFFGPDTAQQTACKNAETKAKRRALQKLTGERLVADDLMVCSEVAQKSDCKLNRLTWSLVDGEIRSLKNRQTSVQDMGNDVQKCTVTLQADIATNLGFNDPDFDLGVELNQTMFRTGEDLVLKMAPSQPMYVQVFQWLPYETDQPVVRIFPNDFDTDSHFKNKDTIPRHMHLNSYAMSLAPPPKITGKQRHWDEYLMVVATRSPIRLRDHYSLPELRSKLLELPRKDSRLIKKGYTILGGSL
ncbi:conserved exported hypothetical protein [Candidatus Terasakiella magnetica]|uniref:Uncharacterized protein n=1 Tax=Candidatus Terasakiella magnetica TaxID=1867952 RepID=A0A1C3RI40_9PROT|nr:DUF4384 domain-containing protein [Candidatus Terasakiella magnetica]SCA56864.1 conserved exported hypothetical protein [Candidatus Terasakiella magnetica]